MNESKHHPLTFVAFLLAVFVLLLPTQAGVVYSALHLHKTATALLVITASIALVVFPLVVAQRLTARHPEKWKPRLLNRITWAIIVFNMVMNAIVVVRSGMKNTASETAASENDAKRAASEP